MARRKKRMKLPNGFGSIKYLGAGRRNPYAVYPPVQEWTRTGPVSPKALGYRETWEDAYELLTTYNMEKQGKIKVQGNVYIDRSPTFAEVYERFYQEKYNQNAKKLSEASKNSTKAAFKNCQPLHDKKMGEIRYEDLQNVVNSCTLKHSSLELIVSLMHQIYRYAMKYEIVEKDYSAFLYIPIPDDDETGVPFSEDELSTLWHNRDNDVVQMILIMCYSGFRIKAYTNMEINLKEQYFKGGVKTSSSKDRIVPIHSCIHNFIKDRYAGKNLLHCSVSVFRKNMYTTLEDIGMSRHTPHDCRHTFSMLCERYGVNENDRKRMLGHSFGNDITNRIYGHRTLDDLREELEKIKCPV